MNEHFYDYLKHISRPIFSSACIASDRDSQKILVINGVKILPSGYRSFVASYIWSMLGYGGGL